MITAYAITACLITAHLRCSLSHAVSRPSTLDSLQLLDHLGQRLPFDELHGIVVHATFGSDCMHWHDIGVVQLGRRLGLVPESLKLALVECRCERQHLQRDAAPERDLVGLIHHAHAAATDLTNDPVVAKL